VCRVLSSAVLSVRIGTLRTSEAASLVSAEMTVTFPLNQGPAATVNLAISTTPTTDNVRRLLTPDVEGTLTTSRTNMLVISNAKLVNGLSV